MTEPDGLDIQRVIDQSAQRTTLSDLARRGIQRVKVLDERAIQGLIRQAVDRVLSTQSGLLAEEERVRIMSDSRRELDRLLREHKEMKSRAELLEAGKNDLVLQIENLQRQLQLQRHLEGQNIQKRVEEETAALQARAHEMEGAAEAAQKELRNLRGQYNRQVGEQTALQAQLQDAQAEVERLQKEFAQARKQEGEGHAQALQARDEELKRKHEEEATALRRELVQEQDRHRQALSKLASAVEREAELRRKHDEETAALRRELAQAQEQGRQALAKTASAGEREAELRRKYDEEAAALRRDLAQAQEQGRQALAKTTSAGEREAELRRKHDEETAALRRELAQAQELHHQTLAKLSASGDLDAKFAALQDNIEKKFQAVQESSLASKLEQLGTKDKETAEKLEKLFARMTDNLTKRLAGMRAMAGGAEEVEFRPGERMLESMFKQELESNMPTVQPEKAKETKGGSVEDALSKLRRMQGLGGGSSPSEKK
jgi:DNA repair exonuclease SbcCD ATPase subunit